MQKTRMKSVIWIIERYILGIPLCVLLYNNLNVLVSMANNPWGHTEFHFLIWRHDFHSLTIVYFTVFYLLLFFYFYRQLDPIIRVACSAIIPLFGIFFYEYWWHVGFWSIWKEGIPVFWGLYALIVGLGIYYIHLKYNILKLTMNRGLTCVLLFIVFLGGWWELLDNGFYQSLLLHDKGLGLDPHGWLIFLDKAIALFMWLLVVKIPTIEKLSNGDAELRRMELQPWNPIQRWWHSHKISQVMKLIPRGPGNVLDLGCGCGDLFEPLQAMGKKVIGLDHDPNIIQYLRDKKDIKNITLVCREGSSTGLDSNSIDIALVLDVIEHIQKPGKLIEEMNRVLKPNGILILTTPHNTLLWRIIWRIWNVVIPYDEHKAFSKDGLSLLLGNNHMFSNHMFTTHFGCLILSVSRNVNR